MSEQYRHPKKRGLTLIEVLLALIILSLSLSAMMLAMGRCLSVIRTARNRDTARSLLQRIHVDYPIEKVDYRTLIETGNLTKWIHTPGRVKLYLRMKKTYPAYFSCVTAWNGANETAYKLKKPNFLFMPLRPRVLHPSLSHDACNHI